MARETLRTSNEIVSIYVKLALTSLGVVWLGNWYLHQDFWTWSLVPSFCLAFNYWYLRELPQELHAVDEFPLSLLFLFQVTGNLVIGHFSHDVGAVYLALAHGLFASSYYHFYSSHKGSSKGTMLILMTGVTVVWELGQTSSYVKWSGMPSALGFTILAFGTVWGVGSLSKKIFFHTFSKILKKSVAKNQDEAWKDKLFFHDIINQTHGVDLFLSHKMAMKEAIVGSEINDLAKEIKVLQSILKEHFKQSHRNLNLDRGVVTFDSCSNLVLNMIHNYLGSNDCKLKIKFEGDLAAHVPVSKRHEILIHQSHFYRIITNLVKNISEQAHQEVDITFSHSHGMLAICLKNKVMELKNSGMELAGKLERIILESKEKDLDESHSGLGLDSVTELCEELGGNFQFGIEGDYWVSRIQLPTKNSDESVESFPKAA